MEILQRHAAALPAGGVAVPGFGKETGRFARTPLCTRKLVHGKPETDLFINNVD
ncbi:hypothetical protein OF848_07865 [Heyndrickxia coagulans]|uniref:hypothetical protein n=1 Tax=Heyndrickxia coagulans TaxID=1398 RepID=UPI0021F12766|nr:hypothetical protein [Heyndrickxia coagulans]UYM83266.1 hypothetical protein OF848_07865 [Heyndrickxia coagulans]